MSDDVPVSVASGATIGNGDEAQRRCVGFTGVVTEAESGSATAVITRLPSATFETDIVGPQDMLLAGDAVSAVVGVGGTPAVLVAREPDAAGCSGRP